MHIIVEGKTMAELEGEFLTEDEVTAYLKDGNRIVYCLAVDGKLPECTLGASWRFRCRYLNKWIAANLSNKDSGARV